MQWRASEGAYEWAGKLGAGSFATVYRARDKATGHEVAVKSINRERLNRKLQENLESEISILRNFRHPNIVELYDIRKTEHHIYLVCELCAGGDLQKLIRQHRRLSEHTARHFMRHLTAGLRFLWEQHLIHRDLKPQNLLLTSAEPTAVLKIADFGFARHLASASMAETLCGSPLYMAPEVLQGRRYDAKADLWSVGTILFEMVVGHPPFGGANHLELLRCIQQRKLSVPEDVKLSESCLDVLRMLLRRNPLERISFEDLFAHSFVAPEPPATGLPSTGAAAAAAASSGTSPQSGASQPTGSGAPCAGTQSPSCSSRKPSPRAGDAFGNWPSPSRLDGRPAYPQSTAPQAAPHWPGAEVPLASSDASNGSHVASSPPFAPRVDSRHGAAAAATVAAGAGRLAWHDNAALGAAANLHAGRSADARRLGRDVTAVTAAVPRTPHHLPFEPLTASPPGAAAGSAALRNCHGGNGGEGVWLPPPLSLGAPAYGAIAAAGGAGIAGAAAAIAANGGNDSMTGSDDYVMVDQFMEPYPFYGGQAAPVRPGSRLAHRLGSRAMATAAAVAAAAAAAAATAGSGYMGIPRLSDSTFSHAQQAAGNAAHYPGRRSSHHAGMLGNSSAPPSSAAAMLAGADGPPGARLSVEAAARYLHVVELFGRRAVLLAQLGDVRVKAAREALQAGYVMGHASAARRRALGCNSVTASLLFGPIDGAEDASAGSCRVAEALISCKGGADGASASVRQESKWEPLGACSIGGTSSAVELAVPALQEQGLRLFGEALVLYLKSLGMIRRAVTWGQQAMACFGCTSAVPAAAIDEQLAIGRNLLSWLRQQSTAVLDRADQCKARLKEKPPALPAPSSSSQQQDRVAGGAAIVVGEADCVSASVVAGLAMAAVAVSAEQLVFDAALHLAREGSVVELLGQFAEARDHYDKACLFIETLLLDGAVDRPSGSSGRRRSNSRNCELGLNAAGGSEDAAFACGASSSAVAAAAAGGGAAGAGSLCESDRKKLQWYLESFSRSAEDLTKKAEAASAAAAAAATTTTALLAREPAPFPSATPAAGSLSGVRQLESQPLPVQLCEPATLVG